MKMTSLGADIAANGTGTAVEMNTTPFMEDASVLLEIVPTPNFNGTATIEGSDDGTSYSNILQITGTNKGVKKLEVAAQRYYRYTMAGFTAGAADFNILADN